MDDFEKQKKSLEFVKQKFKEFYNKNEVLLPDRFSRREYAFVYFGGRGMMRHISFSKKQEVTKYIKQNTPTHSYYSSAYYKYPDAAKMQDKEWMGAELIFDLDSDHLPNADKMSYEKQLIEVKKEFISLVNDFLIKDFGFNEKYLDLYFSGGRGYHCHVKDPKIFRLDSSERREIVDYITGRDLRDSLIFQEHVTSVKKYGDKVYPGSKKLTMPTPNSPGWKGRISRGIIEIINEIIESDDPFEKLKEYGVKEKDAKKLLDDLSEERIKRIKLGNLDQTNMIRKFFLNSALRKTAVSTGAGETDEPVTCDIKRLIRLPGSLHGKTGFKVVKINLEKLKNFNPLNDAIAISENEIKIDLKKDYKINMKDEEFKLKEGINTIPEFLAVFLIGNKIALIKK